MVLPSNPPANPIPGAIYVDTTTNISWVWTGVAWLQAGGSDGYNSKVKYGMAITPGFYSGLSGSDGSGGNLATITTQYGDTAPISPNYGQMWVDTTDPSSPVSKVWIEPGQWMKISDGVTNTSVGTTAPVDPDTGDTWYEQDTDTFHVWDGTVWRPISGGGGGSGSTSVISYSVEPSVGVEGAVYYNTTTNTLFLSDGVDWNAVLTAPDVDTHSIIALTKPTARTNGSPLQAGDNWINTTIGSFNYWNGTDWVHLASANVGDTHSFYSPDAPTVRPNGTVLISGDIWVDSDTGAGYVWNGALWSPISYSNESNTNSILATVAPSTRPNGYPLTSGDLWVNTNTGGVSYWSGSEWVTLISVVDTHSIADGAAPTTRSDGTALQNGDMWTDTGNTTVYVYNGGMWNPVTSATDTGNVIISDIIAPNTRPNGTPLQTGDAYLNTMGNELAIRQADGTWTLVTSSDLHSFAQSTPPTVRTNGSALMNGDLWTDTDESKVYVYNGGLWVPVANIDTNSIASSTAPTSRVDGSALQNGDLWTDTDNGKLYVRNSGAWGLVSGSADTHSIAASSAPTTRTDGSALVNGDQWVDTDNSKLYVRNSGAWVSVSTTDTHSIATASAPTTRTDGSALVNGDQWVDTDNSKLYVRNGGNWVAVDSDVDTHSIASSTAPTTRTDGSALVDGDMWVDTDDSKVYVRNGGSWNQVNYERHTTLGSSTVDTRAYDYVTYTVSANTTFSFTNAAAAPYATSFIMRLINGGSATVTWPTGTKWAGGSAPTLTTSGTDILGFFSLDGGNTWFGTMMSKNAS